MTSQAYLASVSSKNPKLAALLQRHGAGTQQQPPPPPPPRRRFHDDEEEATIDLTQSPAAAAAPSIKRPRLSIGDGNSQTVGGTASRQRYLAWRRHYRADNDAGNVEKEHQPSNSKDQQQEQQQPEIFSAPAMLSLKGKEPQAKTNLSSLDQQQQEQQQPVTGPTAMLSLKDKEPQATSTLSPLDQQQQQQQQQQPVTGPTPMLSLKGKEPQANSNLPPLDQQQQQQQPEIFSAAAMLSLKGKEPQAKTNLSSLSRPTKAGKPTHHQPQQQQTNLPPPPSHQTQQPLTPEQKLILDENKNDIQALLEEYWALCPRGVAKVWPPQNVIDGSAGKMPKDINPFKKKVFPAKRGMRNFNSLFQYYSIPHNAAAKYLEVSPPRPSQQRTYVHLRTNSAEPLLGVGRTVMQVEAKKGGSRVANVRSVVEKHPSLELEKHKTKQLLRIHKHDDAVHRVGSQQRQFILALSQHEAILKHLPDTNTKNGAGNSIYVFLADYLNFQVPCDRKMPLADRLNSAAKLKGMIKLMKADAPPTASISAMVKELIISCPPKPACNRTVGRLERDFDMLKALVVVDDKKETLKMWRQVVEEEDGDDAYDAHLLQAIDEVEDATDRVKERLACVAEEGSIGISAGSRTLLQERNYLVGGDVAVDHLAKGGSASKLLLTHLHTDHTNESVVPHVAIKMRNGLKFITTKMNKELLVALGAGFFVSRRHTSPFPAKDIIGLDYGEEFELGDGRVVLFSDAKHVYGSGAVVVVNKRAPVTCEVHTGDINADASAINGLKEIMERYKVQTITKLVLDGNASPISCFRRLSFYIDYMTCKHGMHPVRGNFKDTSMAAEC